MNPFAKITETEADGILADSAGLGKPVRLANRQTLKKWRHL